MKLLACNANPNLSKLIAKNLGLKLINADVKKFSDKEVFVEINENVRGEDIFVIQSTSFPANDNLMELLTSIDALRRASAKRITAVIPYFGYARQDRKTASRTPITAKLVANIITTAGADRVLTIDLHAGQIQGFFDIPLDNLYAAPVFVKDIKENFNLEDLVIVSPDVGGLVRARAIASKTGSELAIVDKRRPKAGVSEVMNIIGEVEGKNCVIIDDMIDSGGTLCNAAAAIMDKGAKSVSAYITHGILSGLAHDKITNSKLKKLVITNSIEPTSQTLEAKNIKIIDISDLLAKAIYNISQETSVSTLFD
ncbi:MAG: ribose-phosphate pyrophosphokinase [Rickettsiales bacterium]|nr:ribose-phosphate pyrophosphokinase [Rickettsiales bacterium]